MTKQTEQQLNLIILAGGFSTRIGGIGKFVSKALLPIYHTTLLSRQIKQAIQSEIFSKVIVSTNPMLFDAFTSHLVEMQLQGNVELIKNELHQFGSLNALLKVLQDQSSQNTTVMSFADIYFIDNPFIKLGTSLPEEAIIMGFSPVFDQAELTKGGILEVSPGLVVNKVKEAADKDCTTGFRWNGIATIPQDEVHGLELFLGKQTREEPEGEFFQELLGQGKLIKAIDMGDFINNNNLSYLSLSTLYELIEDFQSHNPNAAAGMQEVANNLRNYILHN